MNKFEIENALLKNGSGLVRIPKAKPYNAVRSSVSLSPYKVSTLDANNYAVIDDTPNKRVLYIRGDIMKPLFTYVIGHDSFLVAKHSHLLFPEYHPNAPYFAVDNN